MLWFVFMLFDVVVVVCDEVVVCELMWCDVYVVVVIGDDVNYVVDVFDVVDVDVYVVVVDERDCVGVVVVVCVCVVCVCCCDWCFDCCCAYAHI